MKRKKLLAVFLTLAMLLSLLPTTALAADAATVTAGSAEVNAGDSFSIDVRIADNLGFNNFQLQVVYDKTMLELTNIEDISDDSILKSELVVNPSEGIFTTAATRDNTKNGVIATLTFTAKDAAKGTTTVSIEPLETTSALMKVSGFANASGQALPVTFVPGTITVKANTTDRTVTFMNGTEAAATETVANGGTLTSIPDAPAATDGQSFLGWYAVEGTNYVLSSVEDTITGTEASTQTAITADTTYHAIWASSAMITAGYAADASGKTTMSAISTPNNLQTLITDCNNGKVKLLSDVDLGSNHIEIAQGKAITLDLNGKTLSSTDSNIPFWGSTAPCGTVYVEQGTLTLYSSVAEKGTVHYTFTGTGNWKSFGWGAVENFGGTIPVIKNVTVKTTTVGKGATNPPSALFGRAYADATTDNPAFESVSDCAFICDNGAAFTCVGDSEGEMKTASFKNCTFTGTSIGKSNGVIGLVYTRVNEFTDCTIQANENSAADGTALSLSENAKIISVTGGTMTAPNGIYATSYYGDDLTAIEKFNPNSVTVTAEDGFLMNITSGGFGKAVNVNLNGGKYNTNKIVLEKGTTVTYPAGQKLVAGEDGWYTLQTAYTVTFKNGDTVLQTVTCGNNGTAVYTGSAPTKAADETYTYTFNGKWADESGNIYTGNQVTNVTSDLTVIAQFDTASAEVVTLTVDGNSKNYTGLKAAADALNASSTYNSAEIKLNENDTETEPVTVTKSVTIDLNGHNLTANTAENGITVSGGATLTFKDSVGTGVYKHTATRAEKSAILANDSGTVVNIESGTIEAAKGNGLKVDGAAFHVSGGTITGGNNGIYVATQNASPVCTVSGGKIICKGNGYALNMDQSVAQCIELSGGAFKNTVNTTDLIRKFDGKIKCTFLDGKSLSPSPNTEGFYEVREVGTYTFVLKANKEHYNAGETVTVTVSAYGPDSINSFGFTPSYDSDKLELVNVTSANKGNFTVNNSTGKSGYTVSGNGIALGKASTDATELVTITFTAKENINNTTTITLMDLEMTPSGSETSDKAVVEKKLTVNLHDIRVTLTAANGTINGVKDVTLYAKYNVAGLYSDPARKTTATVSVSANDGYRLNNKTGEKLWKCGEVEYADFNEIKGLPFTDSKTFDLQTTQVWTVSFDTTDVTGGSLSADAPIKVDDGTKLSAAGLPTPTANIGYAFTGWTAGGTAIDPDTYTVQSNITLKPVFTVQSYAFTYTQNQSAVSVTAGVTDGKATYGQDVTFTVTPNDKHIVKQVSYTVGDGTAKTITPENGVYTIPGAKIVGKVALEITTVPYYTVTFKAGTGTEFTPKTVYTLGTGFYTDTTFAADKVTEAPTPAAQAGYRLAEQTGEVLWKDANGTGYTAETVKTALFSADTVLTAQSVKTYKVTFESADSTKAAITGSQTLDAGTTITAIPAATYTAGYTFEEWRIGGIAYASDEALKAVEINSDTTVTLAAKDASYSATLNGGAAAEITVITGITGNQAVHGTDITFKLTAKPGYKVTAVAYQINGGAAVTLTPADGVYTIPGAAITGPVTLQLTSNETVTVTFEAGVNGSVDGTTAFILDKGGKLTEAQLNAVTKTGVAGYTFKEWQIDGAAKTQDEILDTEFVANTTVTAVFDHATYNVAAAGTNGVPTTATHGTNLTFTPTVEGKIVVGVTAKIGGTDVAVTKNANGSYTISGDAITGDLTITAQTVDGSWDFIGKDSYIALSADKKIAVLATGKLDAGNYLLNGEGMYWSSKYNAYVKIVDKDETAETLTAKLAFNASVAAQTLSYTGDINGSNTVTPADGGMINDELHSVARLYVLTEKERLEMDVNGDKKVSTEDIMSILRKYVGSN